MCTSKILPFIFLDNDEFIFLLLDIFTKPLYLNKDNFQQVYTKLNETDFFESTNTNDTYNDNDKYLDSIDPDINYKVDDTCDYLIDTKTIKANTSKELTMITFNIGGSTGQWPTANWPKSGFF